MLIIFRLFLSGEGYKDQQSDHYQGGLGTAVTARTNKVTVLSYADVYKGLRQCHSFIPISYSFVNEVHISMF